MSVFSISPLEGVFRQGEIISNVIQVHLRTDSLGADSVEVDLEEKVHPYALVLTQDCDLDWDFKARRAPVESSQGHEERLRGENRRQAKLVPNILLCELTTADSLRPRLAGGDVLRRIRDNQDERYHFFPAATATDDCTGEGLPELIADFKRLFSIPTDELYLRLTLGMRRRVLLQSPYLQDLSSRFGYYCLRVALPEATPPSLTTGQGAAIMLPPPAPSAP